MQESKNMNIKCLIEILKEKKYVKEVDQFCLGQKTLCLDIGIKIRYCDSENHGKC